LAIFFFRNDEHLLNDNDNDDDTATTEAIAKRATKKSKEMVNTMKLFVKQSDKSTYKVTINNVMLFELSMDHVSIGMSFQQTATAIQQAKDRTKTAKLAGINDLIIDQYVRVVVTVALQNIFDIIDNKFVWAISFAGDKSTYRGQSFFDPHLCACYYGDLKNLHLVTVPMFEHHTTENMFNMVVKFLDTLYNQWRNKLIGVSSNGKNTMTDRHYGFVTRMVQSTSNKVLCI
jgi:hypothetical protein